MLRFFLYFFCLCFITNIHSQSIIGIDQWRKSTDRSSVLNLDEYRQVSKFEKFSFNHYSISNIDYKIPNIEDAGVLEDVLLEIPMLDGNIKTFKLYKNTTLSPELQKKFPELHTYQGASIEDPTSVLNCEITTLGFFGMILSDNEPTIILQQIDNEIVIYQRKNVEYDKSYYHDCLTDHLKLIKKPDHKNFISERAGDCKVRQFKIAIAATGEYTTYFGGVSNALSAITTSLNRINGILQKEVGVVLQLISNNSSIIYTNASTDPYTNNDAFAMLQQNQTNLDAVIGTSNYDIGHVFGTGNSGIAYIGVNCDIDYKAQAVSRGNIPSGDGFDIDIFAHEIGHTLGALHSHYAQSGNCNGSITSSSCFEPGSGSTIMSYSGVCNTADNVQTFSDDYYHANSLTEIGNNLIFTNCGTVLTTLTRPTANAGADFSINKNTPFSLKGTATNGGDSGISLTYNWEQMNNEVISDDGLGNIVTYNSPPLNTNIGGPNFRSFKATTSLQRNFPRFQVLNGSASNAFEMLPNVSRNLYFRFVVRGVNGTGRGCTNEDEMTLSITNSNPVTISYPSTGSVISGGTNINVTWLVNNSNISPINMSGVDILYSTDNGLTYPYVLVTNTTNDGIQSVTIPNIATTNARILLVGNNHPLQTMSAKFTTTFNVAFPLNFLSFDATVQGKKVVLKWRTDSEVYNKGFVVEKSINPLNGYEPIGWVDNNLSFNYNFEDTKVREGITYYYKLKQLDYNGKFANSSIVSAKIENNSSSENTNYMMVYPNPSYSGLIKLYSKDFSDDITEIKLVNNYGMTMRSEFKKMNNNQEYEFDVSNLNSGIYFISLTQNKKNYYSKITILND